jgi:hypothetical protein
MSIIDILSQLQVLHGKPNMMMLYTNNNIVPQPNDRRRFARDALLLN